MGIEDTLNIEIRDALNESRKVCGYNASRCMAMLNQIGAVETAKRLIGTANDSLRDGFIIMWEKNRLDLTIEYLVLKPEFKTLFTVEERQICRDRLASCGFIV